MSSPKRRRPVRETPKPKAVKPKPAAERVNPADITLERVKGTPEKGGGEGGEAWRILRDGKKAGDVFINVIDEAPLGRHPSIQIFLNQKSQGQGIGRIGYRLASEASRCNPS